MSREDPYRLSLSVADVNGRVTKWGYDSPDGRDIPQDIEVTTSLPGGNKDLTTSLLREFTRSNPDNNIGDRVQLKGPGGRSVFDGFFTAFPKALGAQFTVEPAAVGWAALFNFQTGYQMVYVDRESGAWLEPGLDRLTGGLSGSSVGGFSWQGNLGGLVCNVPNTPQPAQAIAEAWYTMPPGLTIASIAYLGADPGLPGGWEAPNFFTSAALTGSLDAGNAATLDSTLRTLTPANLTRRYGVWRQYANGTAATPAAGCRRSLTAIGVYGPHGLALQTIDSTTPKGIYNCDIVADIVQRTGQGLISFTTGPGGSIEPNTVIVPHLAFKSPTTGTDALAKASGFGISPLLLPEWGVYDDRKFFWRTPDPDRLCWKARRSDGVKIRLEGDQLDDLYNGVLVTYTDPGGQSRVVGPPAAYWYGGTALADATDPSLVDTSADNPINAHGISQKWAILQLSQPCTQAGAIALGGVFLAVQSQPQRRGQIEAQGLVGHPTEPQKAPVWRIRAGDYIQIPDSAESDIQRRIVGTRYSHATRTTTLDVGVTPWTLDALLEMLQADLVGTVGG